jgi:hypothetical protein
MGDDAATSEVYGPLDGGIADGKLPYRLTHESSVEDRVR